MEGSVESIGTSLEPTMDLINHSCDPSIVRYNFGTHIVAVALKDIDEGQEVK